MTDLSQQPVTELLSLLMAMSRDGTRPAEAKRRLQALLPQHPGLDLDLVWEEAAYDGAVHYDALLHLPEGTVSLSYCAAAALPWPLRGVHRWSDGDLLRVNETLMTVAEAIACLDFIWDEARLVERLVNACLVREALEKEPIDLSPEETQAAVDAFRRARRLYTAAATFQWMAENGFTEEQLERLATEHARVAKLRERVAAGRVEATLAERGAEFETATVARFTIPDETEARRVAAAIRSGETGFLAAAARRFQEAPDAAGSLFTVLRRGETPPDLAATVFSSRPGEPGGVVGPVRDGEEWAILQVVSLAPARLDGGTRRAIEEALFAEWLTARRRAAQIEWNWGRESPPAGPAAGPR